MLEPVTTSSASPLDDRRTPPHSRWFKGLLLGLLLTMAALLLWQLRQDLPSNCSINASAATTTPRKSAAN